VAREAAASLRTVLRARLHLTTAPWSGWLVAQLVGAAPVTITFVVASGEGSRTIHYLLALAVVLAVEQVVAALLRRRIGPEPSSPADYLTLARAAIGATLAALVVAGFSQRLSLPGTLTWVTALLGVTALDWLDGPLARWVGPTRLGCVLDIEADSWLTLCCAAGAVAWGGLPWWVLLPPLVRYAHPALALLRGKLPAGGGPWWSRVTGVAQMALLLVALAPAEFAGRTAALTIAAVPVSAAQLATMVALLFVREDATAR
jgi:phosphatidylglycerophosphate synthase